MARTKFNSITIEYGGVDLLAGGWLADADGALNGSTQYTTSAVQSVGADAVALDENGNVERACEISIAVDYESEADMLADVIAREGFADAHQRAVLRRGIEGADAAVSVRLDRLPLEDAEVSIVDAGGSQVIAAWWDGTLTADNVDEFVESLNSPDAENGFHGNARVGWDGEFLTVEMTGEYAGVAGNGFRLDAYPQTPYTAEPVFSGGVDEVAQVYDAALSGLDYSSSVAGRGLRVVYRYGFILGGAADA